MEKKYIAIVLCFLVMMQLLGCQKNAAEEIEETEKDPIQVVLDFDYNPWNSDSMSKVISQSGIKKEIKDHAGYDIEFKYAPSNGAEREIFLDNLRIEIMAGSGPDVFLCAAYTSDAENGTIEPIFKYPQKSMRNHLFLPLDSYITNAQYMEWDRMTSVVMDAGNYEGTQYILPTGYTMYITCYKNNEFRHEHSKNMTWDDMVGGDMELRWAGIGDTSIFCSNIFSPFADFNSDCLSFTEDELCDLMKKWKDAFRKIYQNKNVADSFDGCLSIRFDENADKKLFKSEDILTMVPVYSVQGGYKATVTSFAAINVNTRRAEEAFSVVDYWLSEECQTSEVYGHFLRGYGVPSLEGIMTEEKPCDGWSMSKENYNEFCSLRDNITNVDFHTPIDIEFRELLSEVRENRTMTEESVVHKRYMTMQMMIGES